MPREVFTIGHSTHPAERFVELLRRHEVTAIGDVRSQPYSRINPQFNRENLKKCLAQAGFAYIFLGVELGARTGDSSCYENGRVQYDRLALTEPFRRGLDRVQEGMKSYRLALMCAEKKIERLARQLDLPESDMFRSHEQVLEDAYRMQGSRFAYAARILS